MRRRNCAKCFKNNVKGKNAPRFRGSEELEAKAEQIQLLSEMKEKFGKEIVFSTEIRNLDENWIDDLETIFQTYPGNCSIKIQFKDSEIPILIEMYL